MRVAFLTLLCSITLLFAQQIELFGHITKYPHIHPSWDTYSRNAEDPLWINTENIFCNVTCRDLILIKHRIVTVSVYN